MLASVSKELASLLGAALSPWFAMRKKRRLTGCILFDTVEPMPPGLLVIEPFSKEQAYTITVVVGKVNDEGDYIELPDASYPRDPSSWLEGAGGHFRISDLTGSRTDLMWKVGPQVFFPKDVPVSKYLDALPQAVEDTVRVVHSTVIPFFDWCSSLQGDVDYDDEDLRTVSQLESKVRGGHLSEIENARWVDAFGRLVCGPYGSFELVWALFGSLSVRTPIHIGEGIVNYLRENSSKPWRPVLDTMIRNSHEGISRYHISLLDEALDVVAFELLVCTAETGALDKEATSVLHAKIEAKRSEADQFLRASMIRRLNSIVPNTKGKIERAAETLAKLEEIARRRGVL